MSGRIEELIDPLTHWLSVSELASLAGGISERKARGACERCHKGGTWRDAALVVRKRDGKAYEVFAHSLPPELYTKWLAAQPAPLVPALEARQLPALPEKPGIRLPEPEWTEEAKWKLALIKPALAHPPRSRARGEAIAALAAIEHTKPDGRAIRIGERTLSDWIKKYEASGTLQGLVRQRRHDAPRVFITREWDAACQLPEDAKAAIADRITRHIKSLWKSADPGCNNTARLATSALQRFCHEAGWHEASLEDCRITRHAVEKYRQYSLSHTYRKDAKRFFDDFRPRIERDHSLLRPMEQVVGDVHPLDVYVRREDGSTATPRFIAWYDVATHRLCGTLHLLDAGTGVTQALVWASFAEMVEAWGLPTHLYLDNGREYYGRPRRYGEGVPSAIMTGFNELTGLALAMREFGAAIEAEFMAEFVEGHAGAPGDVPAADAELRRNGVTRAMPYNAPGKTGIEGQFASLEKVLKMGLGYIGGNRMNKRTSTLGKEAAPWPDMDTFRAAFKQFLDYWNGNEQRGNLGGKSPNQAWAEAQQDGWKAVKVDRIALIYALSEPVTCMATQGVVTVDGQRYRGDELGKWSGKKITVRYAKWAPELLIYSPDFSRPNKMVPLTRVTRYHPHDQDGARESGRMQSALVGEIRRMEAETEELDIVQEIARDNAARPPAPETVFGPVVSLGPQVDALAETAKRLGPPAKQSERQLGPGEYVDRETGEVTRFPIKPIHSRKFARREQEKALSADPSLRNKQGAG